MKYLLPFDLINEAKQVGTLYHWTNGIYTLGVILRNDFLRSSYSHVSFSRNKNLNFDNRPVRITFDGNRMSDKFKFEPFLFKKDLQYKMEAEERIKCVNSLLFSKTGIGGIIKYITDIEIDVSKLHIQQDEYSNIEEFYSKIDELNKLVPQIKIKIKNIDDNIFNVIW